MRVCLVDMPYGSYLVLPAEAAQYLSQARHAVSFAYDSDKLSYSPDKVAVRFADESAIKPEGHDFTESPSSEAPAEVPVVREIETTDIPF